MWSDNETSIDLLVFQYLTKAVCGIVKNERLLPATMEPPSVGCRRRPVNEDRHECRCKIRMSGLSKVEMPAFIGGRGRYGKGANRL
jgi:hypothetical protein